jgi:CSLREA domain-containing protein
MRLVPLGIVAFARRTRVQLPAALALLPAFAGATTLTVTTVADADAVDGACSLREAILAANGDAAQNECPAGSGADRIVFALALPATIALASDLPTITSTLKIQGPGAADLILDGLDLHTLLDFESASGGEWLGVEEVTLHRGFADAGGGAHVSPGETARFRRVRFLENRASNGGGGAFVAASSAQATHVAFDECWFEGNLALGPTGGGGLCATGELLQVDVDRTTFSLNQAQAATGIGGALRLTDGSLTLRRSTLSGNLASESGGAIYVLAGSSSAALGIFDSTLTANQAEADGDQTGDGGGLNLSATVGLEVTLELGNSIVAGNLDSGALTRPDVAAFSGLVLDSQGFNLIGSNEGGSAFFVAGLPNADGDWIGTAAAPIDPLLEALADHGGFAPTHRPTADLASPLIDQGSCPGSGGDQRGYGDALAHLRVVDTPAPNGAGDACDIGAFERGGNPAAEPTLFADDFEAGHALYWSAAVP